MNPSDLDPMPRLARKVLQLPITDRLDAMERALVEAAMQQADRCIKDAAALLGIHRKALARILARHEDLRWAEMSNGRDEDEP